MSAYQFSEQLKPSPYKLEDAKAVVQVHGDAFRALGARSVQYCEVKGGYGLRLDFDSEEAPSRFESNVNQLPEDKPLRRVLKQMHVLYNTAVPVCV